MHLTVWCSVRVHHQVVTADGCQTSLLLMSACAMAQQPSTHHQQMHLFAVGIGSMTVRIIVLGQLITAAVVCCCLLLQLVGPLLGPLLGGVLSQVWGWRSTFICLVVFCGGVVAPLLLLLVPETHQYMVVKRLIKTDPAAAKQVVGECSTPAGNTAW